MGKDVGILLDNETLDLKISVKRDTQGKISSGLVIGNTLYQNQYVILKAQKGEIKEHPLMGAGIDDIANDNDIVLWKKLIREELNKDGFTISQLSIGDTINIKATY